MSHSPSPPRALAVVYEENDPYRVVKKSPRTLDSDSSEFDVIHSRTASDSSTNKLYHPTTDYDDPYTHIKKPKGVNRETERANSYLPYSHHRRDPNQPPASTMYIEEYIPHASTSLGVGSMLQDSLAEPMAPLPLKETPRMIEELPKKKKGKELCGLRYRTIALILFLWIVIIIIIWYFVWPRVPNLSISQVNDDTDIKVVTNSTKKSFSTQWNVSITADNSVNWVPTRFNSINLELFDTKTLVKFGYGSSGFMVLKPKKKSTFSVPVAIFYQTDSLNDTTFQDLYNACGVQISSNVPSENRQDMLNVTLLATYHIAGIVWNPTRNIIVRSLTCPTS
ncbi:hypothetical protein G6F56_003645 [Rhizopus delemar]|uniref:Late embryogenesis abundant protein LEA-2 subgroup domain-containing protein n=1 Tax=Rhizopus stolonifer TaxID=4846 RepID=A0A367J4H6_RHIST|nr:hypothetical protein G6F56_003645 [Rhizopus delemar]RCH84837.1 hypothetical protein CU098_007603 [Rhizopus stolonifer]